MGSTLAALMADGEQVLTVHVGDSRVYLNRNAKLQRLTRDHRFNDDPKVKNMIEPDSTVINEMGNVLTRAMGIRRQVDPDVGLLLAEEGDAFLLASDGLTDMVEDQTIAKVLELDRSLGQKAQDLIDLALAGGGRDNVTVVLVETAPKSRLRGFFSKITKQN
jgi:protein phosphatase